MVLCRAQYPQEVAAQQAAQIIRAPATFEQACRNLWEIRSSLHPLDGERDAVEVGADADVLWPSDAEEMVEVIHEHGERYGRQRSREGTLDAQFFVEGKEAVPLAEVFSVGDQ